MLTDIALGQYYPGNSLIHKSEPADEDTDNIIFHCRYFSGLRSRILWNTLGFRIFDYSFITSAADAGSKINKAAVDHHCSDNGNPYVYRAG